MEWLKFAPYTADRGVTVDVSFMVHVYYSDDRSGSLCTQIPSPAPWSVGGVASSL